MYKVKFLKYFVNGNLKGLSYDSSLTFFSLESTCRYVSFLHNHIIKPIKAIDSSDYTCHNARIERE